jgi:hypothetical protein
MQSDKPVPSTASRPTDFLPPSQADRDLTYEFLTFFARMEFALKHAGYVKDDPGRAEPDWNCWARTLSGRFKDRVTPDFQEALRYFDEHPPKKQIAPGRKLDWNTPEPRQNASREEWILDLVRVVRNNLFHGGKFPDLIDPVPEPSRDGRLLTACLAVLLECLELSPEVKAAFIQRIEA